ncbi:hypothetical protein [Streptomyces sp. NPDC008141]|uniref:hypothetical protein n=1 Tax=Streptomyces sp. NPDC008141 TaxID=3364815 RepID=UPI0036E61DC0
MPPSVLTSVLDRVMKVDRACGLPGEDPWHLTTSDGLRRSTCAGLPDCPDIGNPGPLTENVAAAAPRLFDDELARLAV